MRKCVFVPNLDCMVVCVLRCVCGSGVHFSFTSVRFALVLCTSVRWVSALSHAVSAVVSRLGQALITVQAAVFLKGVVGRPP